VTLSRSGDLESSDRCPRPNCDGLNACRGSNSTTPSTYSEPLATDRKSVFRPVAATTYSRPPSGRDEEVAEPIVNCPMAFQFEVRALIDGTTGRRS
jgi:hypothetical protein